MSSTIRLTLLRWTSSLPEPSPTAAAPDSCIFCQIACDSTQDDANFVVVRGVHNFIVLNRFPYTSGHLMVVPYSHQSQLAAISPEAATEMMLMVHASEHHLRAVYNPEGMNLGMNIGESAGA